MIFFEEEMKMATYSIEGSKDETIFRFIMNVFDDFDSNLN